LQIGALSLALNDFLSANDATPESRAAFEAIYGSALTSLPVTLSAFVIGNMAMTLGNEERQMPEGKLTFTVDDIVGGVLGKMSMFGEGHEKDWLLKVRG
jgi:hypothetical protein